ncbi:hypothetical protein R1sor_011450 [Riccia sorocarpa]|uniref:MACPF domain-containing protein n=1 Tax=Riccia sorocarpa TaxID=122646 RepID=A0ABD3I2R4_9MARC
MKDQLDTVQSDLLQAVSELQVVTPGRYQRDEEVIGRASAGLALYGLSFGGSNPTTGLGMKPSCPLLRQPQFCPLSSPADANVTCHESFSSVEAANNFMSAVSSSGHSFTAALKLSGYGFGVEGSHVTAQENSKIYQSTKSFQTSSAARITYTLVPVKSFRIPKDQMKLSGEAEEDARAITSSQQARNFLERFGSHVSNGIHHLGGIFWKIVEIRSKESLEISKFEEAVSSLSESDLSGGGGAFGFSAAVSVKTGRFSTEATEERSKNAKCSLEITTKIATNGPNVTNSGLFAELLAANNQSWFIINRGGTDSLISVWEILKTYESEELVQAAKLIRSAWLQRAAAFAHIAQVQREIRRVRTGDWATANDLKVLLDASTATTAEDATVAASHLLSAICNVDLSVLSERHLTYTVGAFLKRIFDYDHRYGLDLLTKSMQDGELPHFLLKIATWEDQLKVRPVLQFLNSTFDPATLQRLDHAEPPVALPQELICGNEEGYFEVMLRVIVPNLPNRLLNERIAQALLVNLKQCSKRSSIKDKMLAVVDNFAWTEDGFLTDLSFEPMETLVLPKELREVLLPLGVAPIPLRQEAKSILQEIHRPTLERLPLFLKFKMVEVTKCPTTNGFIDRCTPDPAKEPDRHLMYILKHRLEFPLNPGENSQGTYKRHLLLPKFPRTFWLHLQEEGLCLLVHQNLGTML